MHRTLPQKFLAKYGFTLIELVVVIVIIGIVVSLTFVALNSTRARARDGKRIADIRQLQNALEMYRNDNNVYPSSLTPGTALVGANGETYIKKIPAAPNVPDGSCASDGYTYSTSNPSTTYTISYCLGGAVQEAGPSDCLAVPGQICLAGGGGSGCGTCAAGTVCYQSSCITPGESWSSATFAGSRHWGATEVSDDGLTVLASEYFDDVSSSANNYIYGSDGTLEIWNGALADDKIGIREIDCTSDMGLCTYGVTKDAFVPMVSFDMGKTLTGFSGTFNLISSYIQIFVAVSEDKDNVFGSYYSKWYKYTDVLNFPDVTDITGTNKYIGMGDLAQDTGRMYGATTNTGFLKVRYSDDFGVNWSNTTSPDLDLNFVYCDVAVIDDGQIIVAIAQNLMLNDYSNFQVIKSIDGGVNWSKDTITLDTVSPVRQLEISEDGQFMLALSGTVNYNAGWTYQNGKLMMSRDGGATWDYVNTVPGTRAWAGIGMSDDGARLTAVDGNGYLWFSPSQSDIECVIDCAGKNCGPDGCGGVCGTCGGSDVCNDGVCGAKGAYIWNATYYALFAPDSWVPTAKASQESNSNHWCLRQAHFNFQSELIDNFCEINL